MDETKDLDYHQDLSGKVIIITGGANGIGKSCVELLAKTGAKIVIGDCDVEGIQSVVNEISTYSYGEVLGVQVDISIPEDCKRLISYTYDAFGKADVLVNNAAQFDSGPSLTFSTENWNHLFDVNVTGLFNCSRFFAERIVLSKKEGAIINISSIVSKVKFNNYTAYSATKAAVNSITKSLASEWAKYNIRVNAVAPGHTSTEGIKLAISQKQLDYNAITKSIPLKRLAEPIEVAETVMFLSSSFAKYINGHILFIDGGRSINFE